MAEFNNWSSYDLWKNTCSQQSGCLSCLLFTIAPHGNCYDLTSEQIKEALKNKEEKK